MRLCIRCGRSSYIGWTDGNPHDYCTPCLIAINPPPNRNPRERRIAPCRCCGQPGPIAGHGLRRSCYQARRKAGGLAGWVAYHQEDVR